MRPTATALLLALLAFVPGVAAAHPCEATVKELAGEVTRLENLVAADREVLNKAASSRQDSALVFEKLEQKRVEDEAELRIAWQRLLDAQEFCSQLMGAEALAARRTARPLFVLDVKVAYAVPVGNVWGSSTWDEFGYHPAWPMSDTWTGAVPLGVGGRYRFTPGLSAGVYFQWGPAFVTSSGTSGVAGTSGYDMRVGIEAVYGFLPDASWNPWVSLGTGWEWTQVSGQGASVTPNGWEFLNVQAGVDYRLSPTFALGPYLGFVGGNYTNITATGTSEGWGGAIPSGGRAFHGWIQFGVKGTATF
jgi:hypothetical protein